jgi:hypothetical protein
MGTPVIDPLSFSTALLLTASDSDALVESLAQNLAPHSAGDTIGIEIKMTSDLVKSEANTRHEKAACA